MAKEEEVKAVTEAEADTRPKPQEIIKLPRNVISSHYVALFGLKKQVYAGYPTSFTIRVEYTENVDDIKSSNCLELNITHVETEELIPLSFELDETTGDYIVSYHAPPHGSVNIKVELNQKKFILPPQPTPEEDKLPEIKEAAAPRGFVSKAIRDRMEKERKEKEKEDKEKEEKEKVEKELTDRSPKAGVPQGLGSPNYKKKAATGPVSPSSNALKKMFTFAAASYATEDDPEDQFEHIISLLFGGPQIVEVLSGVMKSIGPEGGNIKLGDIDLDIPEGALDREVEISAHTKPCTSSIYKRGFNSVTMLSCTVTFTPYKVKFLKPCTLKMAYKSNSRWPKPSIGRLTILNWLSESTTWQEVEGGKFQNSSTSATATIKIDITGVYGVASASITDASLMPVIVSFGNKQELLAQSKFFYSNLLPGHDKFPLGIGGHMLLVQFSMLRDKPRDKEDQRDRHLYPPVSLGFFMEGQKKDTVHHHAMHNTIDILSLTLDAADKVVYFKCVNKTSQNMSFLFEKGTILEQRTLFGHSHVIVAKDLQCSLRGLQEVLFKLNYFEMTDQLTMPAKSDDLNITPFTIDKAFLGNEKKVLGYIRSKIES